LLSKLMVTLAPAGTVMVLLSNDMPWAIRSIVTLLLVVGAGVDVGGGGGVGADEGVGGVTGIVGGVAVGIGMVVGIVVGETGTIVIEGAAGFGTSDVGVDVGIAVVDVDVHDAVTNKAIINPRTTRYLRLPTISFFIFFPFKII
jgi:hypothetical protein